MRNVFSEFFLVSVSALASTALLLSIPATSASAQQINSSFFSPNKMIELNQAIPLRDGTTVSANIYRPDDSGSYPTLYASAPYPHQSDIDLLPEALGPVSWYIDQGFAVVVVSSRGTGNSGGQYQFLGRAEQQDHYEIIRWIAEQPWSNQKVAGYGSDYYASSQWHMAIQNPPNLSCIAPVNGSLDPYRDWAMPGGITNDEFTVAWYEKQVRDSNTYSSLQRLVEMDVQNQLRAHPLYDAWWQERSVIKNIELIRVPSFAVFSWQSEQSKRLNSLKFLSGLLNSNKLLITEKDPFNNMDFHTNELLPFYQWCFTEEETNYTNQPDLRYDISGSSSRMPDISWPPLGTNQVSLLLDGPANLQTETRSSPGLLDIDSEDSDSSYPSSYPSSYSFSTDTLANDLVVSGNLTAELYISSNQRDVSIGVKLYEETTNNSSSPIGDFFSPLNLTLSGDETSAPAIESLTTPARKTLVTQGQLKASLRVTSNISLNSSSNTQTIYSFDQPQLLTPNRPYRLDIDLTPVAYRFNRGSKIVLEVGLAQDPSLESSSENQLYFTGRYPSQIWMPILGEPELHFMDEQENQQAGISTNRQNDEYELSDYTDALFDSDNPVILLPPGNIEMNLE